LIISSLWNFIWGYLVIKIEGLSFERLINMAVNQGMVLWSVNRPSYSVLTARINIKSFSKLRPILRKYNCRVKILSKHGLPFLLLRLNRRKMLVAGFLIFSALLYSLSSFIWVVELDGTEKIDPESLLNVLSEHNIRPGAFKPNLDLHSIQNQMLIQVPDLIWIGIEIRGSKAIVRVEEATKPPEMIDRLTPFNIVAKADGIIDKIVVLDGEALVEAGDTVRKGQLLVSGIIADNDGRSIRYTHAQAYVTARTWYRGNAAISIKEPIINRTGRTVLHKQMDISGLNFNLKKEAIHFNFYEIEKKAVPLFGNDRFFPINIIVIKYHEITKKTLTIDDLKLKVMQSAWDDVHVKLPSDAKIIDKLVKYDMIEDETLIANIYVEVLEDIGRYSRIMID